MVALAAFEHGRIMRIGWEIIAVLALSAYLIWLGTGWRWPGWLGGEQEITVRVVPVIKRATPVALPIRGRLVPAGETQVVSRLAGRVSELRYQVGQPVARGAVVATVVAHDIAQRQIELENSLVAARKKLQDQAQRLAAAEKLTARTRELFKQDLIARIELEQVAAGLQTARAQTELAQAQLSQQESMLIQMRKIQSLGQITAPIAGVVTRRWVELGATIAESSPLLSIANGNLIKFTGQITGANAALLREGLSALVSAGESVEGIVSRVILSAAKNAASAEVEIQIKTTVARFRFGMTADAVITLDRASETLRVPQSAIVESAGKHYLYKFIGGRALRQEVGLGAREGAEVVVEQGVSAGDLVIVDNLHSLKSKSRVRAAMARIPNP